MAKINKHAAMTAIKSRARERGMDDWQVRLLEVRVRTTKTRRSVRDFAREVLGVYPHARKR